MSIFSIGLSGIRAAQAGLYTTSNNISNVGTPGYNREILQLSENKAQGVQVDGMQRQFNQLVANRLNAASGSLESLDTYFTQLQQIDNVLADERSGLNVVMEKFFASLSQVAGNPADSAAREGAMGSAKVLTAQFRSFDSYLSDIGASVDRQLAFEVNSVNTLTEQVAALNKEILMAKATVDGAPNSLLNQRDQLVHELSQKVDIRVNQQDSGSYSIALSDGSQLVAGDLASQLKVVTDKADPSQVSIVHTDITGAEKPLAESVFNRGAVAGLLEFRSDSLSKLENQVGQMVVAFTAAFNELHSTGVDLNRQPGQAMFSAGQTVTYPHADNQSATTATTTISDASAVLATDYQVRQTASGLQVTRLDTGKVVAANYDAATSTLAFNGLEVTFDGALAEGDSFKLKPLAEQAANFELLLSDGDQIAASESGASGDNRIALALTQLQSEPLVQGNRSLSQAYGAIINGVGNQMNIVQANKAAQQGLTEQLQGLQQSESGVNLDEEAANLIRYQQYYQANAKVIETGTTLLDTILSLR
ncbi:Flagellar hook-associated protein 1 [Pseudidiomarina piscicola]|uniref:Flagellar hook-associated protein 1 n=1 Tax=Pseudidiomarina piscicola TaxID=2614830 RepID=A0A6S6WNH6_9GAMM|nr:flagellar hook-associated protein FlgK [Pseudidiomarina piscicola]CAB0151040.1 Flagellar hook-associated protein 1 [Pseudidiomarina piscicola]VZT40551.1 Flagellar hook-associated protein 1 [Pseudomonas aeruginosa]